LFGERIREIRVNKKFSQEMLVNDADIPINQVGRIERAEITTSLITIIKISKALDVPLKELLDFNKR
jgi:transcriptional regulator with XRE-family HTH domain